MNEPTLYAQGFHKRFPKDRLKLVNQIFEAFCIDYGTAFSGQFADDTEANKSNRPTRYEWKCSLLEKMASVPDTVLADAVDNCSRDNPRFPPTLMQLRTEAERLMSDIKRREREDEERRRLREPKCEAGLQRIEELKAIAAQLRGKSAHPGQRYGVSDQPTRTEFERQMRPFSEAALRKLNPRLGSG